MAAPPTAHLRIPLHWACAGEEEGLAALFHTTLLEAPSLTSSRGIKGLAGPDGEHLSTTRPSAPSRVGGGPHLHTFQVGVSDTFPHTPEPRKTSECQGRQTGLGCPNWQVQVLAVTDQVTDTRPLSLTLLPQDVKLGLTFF